MVSSLFPMTAKELLVKRRGKRLLGPVDLALGGHGITVVIGPNGAGKTTLLKALHGLERINSGEIHWQVTADVARDHQAFVFQSPILLRRSVAGNLAYPLKLKRIAAAEVATKVSHWAERIGLGKALDQRASLLSGGEKQKLALARALIAAPALLFLDEPCTNLDGHATREIEALLQEAKAAGTRILMTTHDLGQARRLADDVIFLHAGEIVEEGPAAACLNEPQTPELAAFLKGDIVT